MELGKALNRAAELRQAADYTGTQIPQDKARQAVDQAGAFIEAVKRLPEQGN